MRPRSRSPVCWVGLHRWGPWRRVQAARLPDAWLVVERRDCRRCPSSYSRTTRTPAP